MADKRDALDPKGLMFEAYRIEGITKSECRSIFLDWVLSLPGEGDRTGDLQAIHARYGAAHPGHPMTEVISEGLAAAETPRRRGGWRSRQRD